MDFASLLVFKSPYAIVFWGVMAWAYTMESIQHRSKMKRMASHDGADRYSGVVEMARATSRAASWTLRAILRMGVFGQHLCFDGHCLQSC